MLVQVNDTKYLIEQSIALTEEHIGKTVLVFQPGKPPYEAVIATIDFTTGLILTVLIKDAEKEAKIIAVKNKVVMLIREVLPKVIEEVKEVKGLFLTIKNFFKGLFK